MIGNSIMTDTPITEELLRKIIREELNDLISCNKCKKLNNKVETECEVKQFVIKYINRHKTNMMLSVDELYNLYRVHYEVYPKYRGHTGKHNNLLLLTKCVFSKKLRALNLDYISFKRTSKTRLVLLNKEKYENSVANPTAK